MGFIEKGADLFFGFERQVNKSAPFFLPSGIAQDLVFLDVCSGERELAALSLMNQGTQ